MRPVNALLALVFFAGISLVRADFADAQREVIMFRSGHWTFNGYIYKPEGKGPFPAVIWNHGHHEHLTKKQPVEYDELAKLFTREGFVLFIPDRHVHDLSRTDYSVGLQKLLESELKGEAIKVKQAEEELDVNANDVIAAFEWLKEQPYIKPDKVALSGWSLGAVTSLAATEKSSSFKAVALFSPRLIDWKKNPTIQDNILRATRNCRVPIMIVLASDESASDSTTAIVAEVEKNQELNRVERYNHTGYKAHQKTALALNAPDTWGYDVLRFIQKAMLD